MVGLGAQDTLGEANDFVAMFGTSFVMLWDDSFESWANFGVSLQPSALLIAPDGTLLGCWLGMPSDDEVLSLARTGNDQSAKDAVDRTAASERFCRYAARYLQADVALAAVADIDHAALPRLYDDVRFAANAMAQTAAPADAAAARAFADSVQGLATVAIAGEFDADSTKSAEYATAVDEDAAAVPTLRGPSCRRVMSSST